MTFTTGYPADDNTVYTLVIPRVFGDNGHRKGVTNEMVFDVMTWQNWGVLQGIDCLEKRDFRTGENFRMMFVRWVSFAPPDDIMASLEAGQHIEVTTDNHGHFWKVSKFVPRAKVASSVPHKFVQAMPVAPPVEVVPMPSHASYADAVQSKTDTEFIDNMDAFCQTGLTYDEMVMADTMHADFGFMDYQNMYGEINELSDNQVMYDQ